MKKDLLKGKITISKPSSNSADYIRIEIVDDNSRIQFLELKLSLENFAQAITGLSRVDVEYEIRNPEAIGKKKEVEKFSARVPAQLKFNKNAEKEYIKEHYHRDGWFMDLYLGSQDSYTYKFNEDDVYYANISYYRYV